MPFFSRIRCLLPLLPMLVLPLCMDAQTSLSIHDVMQSLPGGPYLGRTVSTSGIVVGVMSGSSTGGAAFYISEPSTGWDSLQATAEGMPIFSNSVAACNSVSDGDVVTVVGTVVNGTLVNAADTPGTGIQPTGCTVTGTAAVTQSIDLAHFGALTSFGDALKYTGMAATDQSFVAISPSGGSVFGSAVVGNGQFWGVLSSGITPNEHMFRSTGIAKDESTPSGAPSGVPAWSGNPQKILIDTTTFGGTAVNLSVGQTMTCTNTNSTGRGATAGIGVMDSTLGYARLLIFKETACSVSGTVATPVSAAADTTHFKVGTLDVNGMASTDARFGTELAKATLAVTNVFGSPDIFALQEVKDQATLHALASAVNSANGGLTAYAATVTGADATNSGFLINGTMFKNTTFTEVGRNATYTTASGGTGTLWEHPPLVATGEFVRTGKNYPVTIVNVDLTPRDNIGDSSLGADVRAHRAAQAAAVSALVQQYQSAGANLIVAGNLNAYEYNDGYVDVTGVVDGAPAAASAVTLYQATSTSAALHDFTTDVTANTRYNVIERGNAASVEHILASDTVTDASTASASLASYVNAVTQPHFSTDYAATTENDGTTPAGLTPHDGFLVNFAIPPVPTTASISPNSIHFGDVSPGASSSQTVTVTNTTTFTSTVTIASIAVSGTNSGDFSQTSSCLSLTEGSTCTVTVTFKPTATGTRTATLTIMNDSASNGTLTVALTGNGKETTATLTPASANYGTQILDTTSDATVFTWTNPSTVPLTVSSVTSSGDFSVSATTCTGQIAANTSCTIGVVFAPKVLKTRTGTLTVVSSATANPTLTASLTGVGVAEVEPDADTLSFGNIDLGSSATAQTFTVTNSTDAAIALTGMTVSGDYAYTTTCGSALAGKASCTVSVIFRPTATGVRAGAVSITTNDTKYPLIPVALTGNGVDFSIALSSGSGSVIAGESMSGIVGTVKAIGGFNAQVALSCATQAAGSTCDVSPSTYTLGGTSTSAVTIRTTSKYTVIGYGGLLRGRGWGMGLMGFAGAWMLLLARRRAGMALRVMLLLAGVMLTMSGCSGKLPDLNAPYTEPGTYDFTITVTDGQISHAATYSLTVTAK